MTTAPKSPIYVQFLARIQPEIDALGITVHDKKHWIVLEGPNEHRIAIAKSAKKLPRIETTLDLPVELPEVQEKIEDNGRMKTALIPRPDVMVAALEMLVDMNVKLPAAKRGGATSEVPDLDALLAKVEAPASSELHAE